MPKKDRINCFDFIEFPAKSIEDLNRSKVFYMNVFGWSYKDWGYFFFSGWAAFPLPGPIGQ